MPSGFISNLQLSLLHSNKCTLNFLKLQIYVLCMVRVITLYFDIDWETTLSPEMNLLFILCYQNNMVHV